MPDFIIEYNRVCAANLHFHKEVKGSKGEIYHVYYGDHGFGYLTWSCSCPAYKYGHGKDCKHILAVQKEKCCWNEEGTYTGSNLQANADHTCPECGGPTEVIKVAV